MLMGIAQVYAPPRRDARHAGIPLVLPALPAAGTTWCGVTADMNAAGPGLEGSAGGSPSGKQVLQCLRIHGLDEMHIETGFA